MKKSFFIKLYLILLGICLWIIFVARFLLDFKYSFPYVSDFLSKQGYWLFWPLANFDGVHYLLLASEGYVRDLYQAFFPLYPLLISLFSNIFKNLLLSGLAVSHFSFVTALYYFYKLIRIDFSKKIAKKTLLLLVFFPTSFYFLNVYTEGLFLALTFAFFYYLRKRRFWLAAILAGLASATRLVGVFLIVPYVLEYIPLLTRKNLKKRILPFLTSGILSISGFLLYAHFLYRRYSDPFKFLSVQNAFGAERSSDKLILLYQVFYRYLKMFLTVDRTNPIFYTINLEFMITVLFLVLLLLAFFVKKFKIRQSYTVFSGLAFILPTLTGTLSSMPRYVLVSFAGFMVLGQIKHKWFFRFILVLFITFLIINAVLFYRGYWIG